MMEWLVQALSTARELRDLMGPVSPEPVSVNRQKKPQSSEEPLRAKPIGPAKGRPRRKAPAARKRSARPPEAKPKPAQKITVSDEGVTIPVKLFDRDAVEVVRRLRRFDHTAYVVGGCVRDLLVGAAPKDFDVSTSARPEEIKKIFRNSRIIGRRFRLAHIYFRGGKLIETSTFRGQATAEESSDDEDLLITRDNVWGTEEEDAVRRDFTINGMFFDVPSMRVIDHVGGLEDIEAKRIRTIGDADIRLREDPVRILRAARFAAKLGFELDPVLHTAMLEHRYEIARCSQARVLEETFKLIRSGHSAASVAVMNSVGLLEIVLPEVAAYFETHGEEGQQLVGRYLAGLDAVVKDRETVSDSVVLAALLHAPLDAEIANAEPHMENAAISDYVARVTIRMGATKRVRERLRQIFTAQRNFRRTAGGQRSRRRVSPQTLMKRGYFTDALDLFDVWTRAHDDGQDEVAKWRQRTGDIDEPMDDDEPEPRPAAKRRRRRRGRKRKPAPAPTEG